MSLQHFIILAVSAAVVAAQSTPLTVNTPTSVQACLPAQLTWSGGVPPYFVSIIPGGNPTGPIIKDFGQQTGTSLTWQVDQSASQPISVQIRDSTGAINYSDKVTIQPSTQSCGSGSSASSGSSSAANTSKSGTAASSTPSPTSNSSNSSSNTSGSPAVSSSSPSPAPSAGSSAAATGASSDASLNTPQFLAVTLAGALALFA